MSCPARGLGQRAGGPLQLTPRRSVPVLPRVSPIPRHSSRRTGVWWWWEGSGSTQQKISPLAVSRQTGHSRPDFWRKLMSLFLGTDHWPLASSQAPSLPPSSRWDLPTWKQIFIFSFQESEHRELSWWNKIPLCLSYSSNLSSIVFLKKYESGMLNNWSHCHCISVIWR